jgi:hypothetical protein
VSNDNGRYMSRASWAALVRRPEDFQQLMWMLHMAADLAEKVSLQTLAAELLYMQNDIKVELDEERNH